MIDNGSTDNFRIGQPGGNLSGMGRSETTGRHVVVFAETEDAPQQLLRDAGLNRVVDSRDLGEGMDVSAAGGADAIVFHNLNIAVVSAEVGQLAALQTSTARAGAVLSVSPELIHHVLAPTSPEELTAAYRLVVGDLSQHMQLGDAPEPPPAAPPYFRDTDEYTWGLQAVRAISSPYSGKGVKVAVLDTGFDLEHPDFAGRSVTVQSFIEGEDPQDGHGHGTHCIGTSCGPRTPGMGRRYGIAYEAEIYAGKVLSNEGSGSDAQVLAGMSWAIDQGCAVISMSLGADVAEIHPPYTAAGRRALDQGSLIVAAAGNNADRVNGNFGFVGSPANSSYIMAVGALTQQLDVAFFSARTLDVNGGQVDVAGPGFQVYSSWPMPQRYNTISGTSMATPHAAGVAALLAEKTGYRGRELWSEIVQNARRLLAPSVDVGAGLVIAPQ